MLQSQSQSPTIKLLGEKVHTFDDASNENEPLVG